MTQINSGKEVLLYIGEDLSELQIINHMIPGIISMGLNPVILEAQKKPTSKPNAHTKAMDTLSFYHRDILQDTIFPFMEEREIFLTADGDLHPKIVYTPRQMAGHFGLEYKAVDDVNSQEHYDYIKRKKESGNVLLSTSERCTHIFNDHIATLLNSIGPVINSHPGKLPSTRGVLPVLWAMMEGAIEIQWSAQGIVDGTIDTGPVYGSTSQPVEKDKSVFYHYNNCAPNVAAMMLGLIEDVTNGIEIIGRDIDLSLKPEANSYPDVELTDAFEAAQGRIVEPRDQMADFLGKLFGGKGPHRKAVDVVIRQAICDKFDTPDAAPTVPPIINTPVNGVLTGPVNGCDSRYKALAKSVANDVVRPAASDYEPHHIPQGPHPRVARN